MRWRSPPAATARGTESGARICTGGDCAVADHIAHRRPDAPSHTRRQNTQRRAARCRPHPGRHAGRPAGVRLSAMRQSPRFQRSRGWPGAPDRGARRRIARCHPGVPGPVHGVNSFMLATYGSHQMRDLSVPAVASSWSIVAVPAPSDLPCRARHHRAPDPPDMPRRCRSPCGKALLDVDAFDFLHCFSPVLYE